MDYRIHENGWTVIVDDFDLKKATPEDISLIGKLLATQTVVVFKNQSFTLEEETEVIKKFPNPEHLNPAQIADSSHLDRVVIKNTDDMLVRVTGELDEHGRPGLFAHTVDLDWHCNHSSNPWRKPLVWLYSVKGTVGSRTSWMNNHLSYLDLSEEDKEYYKTIKMINGHQTGKFTPMNFGKEIDINFMYNPDLVYTNQAGVTGLFFPFLQMYQIVGMDLEESDKFIQKLRKHVEQEKYIYHHDWQDGEVIISDQWLGLHKRWEFEAIDKRLLHRASFDYPKF